MLCIGAATLLWLISNGILQRFQFVYSKNIKFSFAGQKFLLFLQWNLERNGYLRRASLASNGEYKIGILLLIYLEF